jgi:hypothetical protein
MLNIKNGAIFLYRNSYYLITEETRKNALNRFSPKGHFIYRINYHNGIYRKFENSECRFYTDNESELNINFIKKKLKSGYWKLVKTNIYV